MRANRRPKKRDGITIINNMKNRSKHEIHDCDTNQCNYILDRIASHNATRVASTQPQHGLISLLCGATREAATEAEQCVEKLAGMILKKKLQITPFSLTFRYPMLLLLTQ